MSLHVYIPYFMPKKSSDTIMYQSNLGFVRAPQGTDQRFINIA